VNGKSTTTKQVLRYMDPAEVRRRIQEDRKLRRANWQRPGPKPGGTRARKAQLHGPPRPLVFYVPETLDLERFPAAWRCPIMYLTSTIHLHWVRKWKWLSGRDDRHRYVRLKSRYLTKIVPPALWPRIRHRLEDDGLLECDGATIAGKKCLGYRLGAAHRQARATVCADDAFARKVRRLYEEIEQDLQPQHHHLRAWLGHLDIDLDGALALVGALRLKRKKRKAGPGQEPYTTDQFRQDMGRGTPPDGRQVRPRALTVDVVEERPPAVFVGGRQGTREH
jgi:hypothetical protein